MGELFRFETRLRVIKFSRSDNAKSNTSIQKRSTVLVATSNHQGDRGKKQEHGGRFFERDSTDQENWGEVGSRRGGRRVKARWQNGRREAVAASARNLVRSVNSVAKRTMYHYLARGGSAGILMLLKTKRSQISLRHTQFTMYWGEATGTREQTIVSSTNRLR